MRRGSWPPSRAPGITPVVPLPFPQIQQGALSPAQGRARGSLSSPHQFFPEPSGEWLTCVVRVGTTGAMAGAEAGGARVAVLGLGASRAQAADLTVGPIHHLHKLTAPAEGAEQHCSGLGLGGMFPPPGERGWARGQLLVPRTYLSMKSRLGLCSSSPG